MRMLLYLSESALSEARRAQVMEMGLTLADADLLLLVGCLKESATSASLSRWLKRKPPTITELVDRMEARGLVERQPIAGNKKSKRVVLTEKGHASLQEVARHDIITTIVNRLSDDEYGQLWRLLEKLKDSAATSARELK